MAEEPLNLDSDKLGSPSAISAHRSYSGPQTPISPQNAHSLQLKLFELFKATDTAHKELFDLAGFSSVVKQFLPNADQERIQEMFHTLDENEDGFISYKEFLDHDNFVKFLEYMGYHEEPQDEAKSGDISSKKVQFEEDNGSDFDLDDEADEEEIRQILITHSDAAQLKEQLFELCKHGDIDGNELIDFEEFSNVISKFIPRTTPTRMKQMFDTLDENKDGDISYVEFLTDKNFNKFLESCGYVTADSYSSHATAENLQHLDSVTDIARRNLSRTVSVHNAHDKQIVLAQKEVIEKLTIWINNEGKPAIKKAEELQLQVEELRDEMAQVQMKLDEIQNALSDVNDEKKTLQENLELAVKERDTVREQLKDTETELEKASKTVSEYYETQKKVQELQTKLHSVQTENEKLKQEDEGILHRNKQFESTNTSLQEQLKHRTDELEAAKAANVEKDEEITRLQADLEQVQDELAGKDEVIEDLKDKLGLTEDGDTWQPISNDRNHTIRQADDDFALLLQQRASTKNNLGTARLYDEPSDRSDFGGFHQQETDPFVQVPSSMTKMNPASQSVYENEQGLQDQIFAFQAKEKQWMEERKQFESAQQEMKQRLDGLAKEQDEERKTKEQQWQSTVQQFESEQMKMKQQLIALQRQMEEEREAHMMEMEQMMQQQRAKDADEYKQSEAVEDVQNEDEEAPLISGGGNSGQVEKQRSDRVSKQVDEQNQASCVCFNYALW
eukprot:CAMPEP_0197024428 /NCGR_PEP_ID=MMETSP1384-20130603/4970_1 /TAXON_ID=29189 /ORGANISM="Ammonia sp." /LENGTH=730 /DNA_ID=CAMNT_0042452809 /DNA_START=14 /DNA_END=2203 /DNA_ORIENTATION=+